MQMIVKRTIGALALALAATWGMPMSATAQSPSKAMNEVSPDGTMLQISARSAFPISKKVSIGVGRSLMMQFPMELRDVMIADPTKVDAVVQSSDRVFLVAKGAGTTNAFFFDAQGQQVMTLEIVVGSDLSGLDNLLKKLMPSSNIRSELAGSAVVLTGSVRSPIDASRATDIAAQYAAANKNLVSGMTATSSQVAGITTTQISGLSSGTAGAAALKPVINLLTVEGEDQVMLKVTVAEVQRSVLKQFGINVGASISAGNLSTAFLTANALPLTSPTLGALGSVGILNPTLPATATSPARSVIDYASGCFVQQPGIGGSALGNSGSFSHMNFGNSCISQTLRALERQGLVRTLAEPNLTAVSGESAKFLAGGEYPVPVSADNGTIGISFKEFGVSIAFTPIVMSEGRISLKIDTEVSELSNEGALVLSGTQIPSLKKRSARSTLELPSGGSMAMAGLISESTRQNIDGFPGLKDLPVLGTLFRSRDFTKAETELVVIVTPYLVRPTARQNLARPDDGMAPASDLKANFLGHLNRVYGKGRELPASGGLKGDYGFIVE
jgi:pilus assembly protein CpaC